MNKQPVLNILKHIFHAYGYEIDSSYISDLVVSRGTSDRIYIKLDQDIDYNAIRTFADSMKHTQGSGLYILNNTAPEDLEDFVTQHDLVLWDKHDMENEIGRAILSNAQGQPMEFRLTASGFEPAGDKPKQSPGLFDMFNTSASLETESDSKRPGLDTPADKKQDASYRKYIITEEPVIQIQLPSMPINMPKSSAIRIGQAKIEDVEGFLLKFIPYYSYAYNFNTKRKFRSKIINLDGHGEGIINAITSEDSFTKLPQPSEYIEISTENYQIKEAHITDKEALEIAIDAIIKKHSQNLKLDEVKEDAIIYESRVVSPEQKDINITIRLVYVPVWEIQGTSNTIDINAYDGHFIEEPVDNDAEFV
jgi:hypothetical protein